MLNFFRGALRVTSHLACVFGVLVLVKLCLFLLVYALLWNPSSLQLETLLKHTPELGPNIFCRHCGSQVAFFDQLDRGDGLFSPRVLVREGSFRRSSQQPLGFGEQADGSVVNVTLLHFVALPLAQTQNREHRLLLASHDPEDHNVLVTHGPKIKEGSWFPKYLWSVLLCANCRKQLGWRFELYPKPNGDSAYEASREQEQEAVIGAEIRKFSAFDFELVESRPSSFGIAADFLVNSLNSIFSNFRLWVFFQPFASTLTRVFTRFPTQLSMLNVYLKTAGFCFVFLSVYYVGVALMWNSKSNSRKRFLKAWAEKDPNFSSTAFKTKIIALGLHDRWD